MNSKLFSGTLALGLLAAVSSYAAFQGAPSPVTTVAEALKMGDDTPVVLRGKIQKAIGHEKYIFADETGNVTVEIDNEDWRGVDVGPEDTIVIRGEVDKDIFTTEIDVDVVELATQPQPQSQL